MISTAEALETALAPAAEEPKSTKKAKGGARGAHVAPKKGKAGKKASPGKKAPKAREESQRRPGRQQGCQDSRPAEAV